MKSRGHSPAAAGARRARQGFSALELLVVVAVAGVLLALLFVLEDRVRNIARASRTRTELERLHNAVQDYMLEQGIYPPNLEAVRDSLGREFRYEAWAGGTNAPSPVPLDAWDEAYEYRYTADQPHTYVLFSKGPDRLANTDDDVGVGP